MSEQTRQPGERWLEPEDGLGLFVVYEGGKRMTVALHQYHADALLLVHGRELVEAAWQAADALAGCYDVTEWPASGETTQDVALTVLQSVLAKLKPREG